VATMLQALGILRRIGDDVGRRRGDLLIATRASVGLRRRRTRRALHDPVTVRMGLDRPTGNGRPEGAGVIVATAMLAAHQPEWSRNPRPVLRPR